MRRIRQAWVAALALAPVSAGAAAAEDVQIECAALGGAGRAMLEARARAELLAHPHAGHATFRCDDQDAWLDWRSELETIRQEVEPTQTGDVEAWLAALGELLDRDRTRRTPKLPANLAFEESPTALPSFGSARQQRLPERLWRLGLGGQWELWDQNAQSFGPRVMVGHREGPKGVALMLAATWPQLPDGFRGHTLEGALAFEWSPFEQQLLVAAGGLGVEYFDISNGVTSASNGLIFGQVELQLCAPLDEQWELVLGPGVRVRNRRVRVELDGDTAFGVSRFTALFNLGIVLKL